MPAPQAPDPAATALVVPGAVELAALKTGLDLPGLI
jgi:hypothetical protein